MSVRGIDVACHHLFPPPTVRVSYLSWYTVKYLCETSAFSFDEVGLTHARTHRVPSSFFAVRVFLPLRSFSELNRHNCAVGVVRCRCIRRPFYFSLPSSLSHITHTARSPGTSRFTHGAQRPSVALRCVAAAHQISRLASRLPFYLR